MYASATVGIKVIFQRNGMGNLCTTFQPAALKLVDSQGGRDAFKAGVKERE